MGTSVSHPLRERVREARNLPGTYRMVAADGEIVYVGTSKQVRTRLLSYLRAREDEKAQLDALWSDNFGVTNRYEMPLKSSTGG